MSFTESIKTCFQKYVVFEGRASRSEYWYWQLFVYLAVFAVSFVTASESMGILHILLYFFPVLPLLFVECMIQGIADGVR